MSKIGLIGFGEVGREIAKVLVQDPSLTCDIVAFDIKKVVETVPGPAKGFYEEICDAIGILGTGSSIKLTYKLEDLKGSDMILFSAGLPRRADQTRADLIGVNVPIIGGICDQLKNICPDTFFMMITNPLDALVELAYRRLGFPPHRIVGQAGVLDSGRFVFQTSLKTGLPCSQIEAMTLGGHSKSMAPLYSQAKAGYKSIKESVSSTDLEDITERVRDRGRFIIQEKGHSASFSTAIAVLRMVRAYLLDTKEIMACCTRLQGEYGFKDIFAGVPTEISAKGVRVVEISLSAEERAAFEQSVESVKKIVQELDQVSK